MISLEAQVKLFSAMILKLYNYLQVFILCARLVLILILTVVNASAFYLPSWETFRVMEACDYNDGMIKLQSMELNKNGLKSFTPVGF